VQLLRLRRAFDGCDLAFCTVREGYRAEIGDARFHVVPDANRWDRLGLVRTAWAVLRVVMRERPRIVVSTGAAPGLFGIAIGKLFGARTIWVDSIANAETLSMSGRCARRIADLWLTQWPHLATPDGPFYEGSVL
jgi:hypothetical protein